METTKEYIERYEKETMLMPNFYAVLACILHKKSISKALSDQGLLTRETEDKK